MQSEARWVIAGLLSCFLLAGCHDSDGGGWVSSTVEGSGVFVEEDRPLGTCTAVTLFGTGRVILAQGPVETLVVRGEDNILPWVMTTVNAGVLEIRTDPTVDIDPTQPVEYHVTMPEIGTLSLVGVGTIEGQNLAFDTLTLSGTGVGTVELTDLQATAIDATVSGVVEVKLSGTAPRQELVHSSVSDYRAHDLASQTVEAHLSGLGSATVRVSDSLTVTIGGEGSLYYIGSPTVNSTITGSGTVQPVQ